MNNIQRIQKRAAANAAERLELVNEVRDLVLKDPVFLAKCEAIGDDSFVRKLIGFPGDITTHRLAKNLAKIG
jgi:hypothetical protein